MIGVIATLEVPSERLEDSEEAASLLVVLTRREPGVHEYTLWKKQKSCV